MNHELALQYLEIAAEVGDLNARFTLANWYTSGELERRLGRPTNSVLKKQGIAFMKEAADAGNPVAAFNMGLFSCAASNEFTTQNYEEAVQWYTRAIAGGFSAACINLGTMYRTGMGVQKDPKKAKELFELGASRGDQMCKDILEIMNDPDLYDEETGTLKGEDETPVAPKDKKKDI